MQKTDLCLRYQSICMGHLLIWIIAIYIYLHKMDPEQSRTDVPFLYKYLILNCNPSMTKWCNGIEYCESPLDYVEKCFSLNLNVGSLQV